MTLGTSIAGWSAFGLAVRAWQLGIMKKPVASGPAAYALSGGAFGVVGYFVYGWEQRQKVLIAEKELLLKQRKEAVKALAAAES